MTVEFDGVPYADTFRVEVRWVGTMLDSGQIQVEVGVEVDFQKQTFLKNKIRAATIEETIAVHQDLYEAVKAECGIGDGDDDEVEMTKGTMAKAEAPVSGLPIPAKMQFAGMVVLGVALFVAGGYFALRAPTPRVTTGELSVKIDKLESELLAVKATLLEIKSLLQNESSCRNDNV